MIVKPLTIKVLTFVCFTLLLQPRGSAPKRETSDTNVLKLSRGPLAPAEGQAPSAYSESRLLSVAHTNRMMPRGSAPKKGDIRFEMLSKREKIDLSNRKQASRGSLAPAEGQAPSLPFSNTRTLCSRGGLLRKGRHPILTFSN